jgi:hypothetical protein
VAVPEPRLDALAKIAGSKEIIPARITFVDIAGLVRGASKGEGLGNQFLANIRDCDAVAFVARCFEDGDIVHVEGRIDPISDLEIIEMELMLADLESLEKRVPALEKRAKTGGDKESANTLRLATIALNLLREGRPARAAKIDADDEKAWHMLQLLTALPALYVCNVDEGSADKGNKFSDLVAERAAKDNAKSVVISAQIESEIALLDAERARRVPRDPGPGGAGPEPPDPRGLQPAGPADLFHGRPQGSPRLDHPRRRHRPAGGRRHPHRLREGLHPRREPSPSTTSSSWAAKAAPRKPARCGPKARTTSSRTAT